MPEFDYYLHIDVCMLRKLPDVAGMPSIEIL
jgi:hypothetical protein